MKYTCIIEYSGERVVVGCGEFVNAMFANKDHVFISTAELDSYPIPHLAFTNCFERR